MEKILETYVALPMPTQMALGICVALGVIAIILAAIIGISKVMIAGFNCTKAVPVVSSISISVAICVGLAATSGYAGCVAGVIAIVAVIVAHEIGYYGRYEQSNKNSDPQS